jgi:AcrR family transcriptional regulator
LDVRVKTEDRRQAIIEVAIEVFGEVGFERATMAMISRRLGGSKGTLYGYFKSKEELFESAMRAAVEGPGDEIMNLLDIDSNDLHRTLENFATSYLNFILGREVLAITRTAVAEGAESSLGAHLFAQGPGRAIIMFTKFFAKQMELGRLRSASPLIASLHFKGLTEAGFLEEALYGAAFPVKQREAMVAAVDTFMRAYKPVQRLPKRTRGQRRS